MKVINCVQGGSEWFSARCAHVSASRVADALAVLKRKEGESAARRNLRMTIVSERLTEKHADHYVSPAMEHGTEMEPLARTEYEIKTGTDVRLVGYVLHPTIEWSGASPDGLCGDSGLIEIKAPNTTTHLDYLMAGVVPELYRPQMYWQMACTGRQWCDFVSFDPRLPEKYKLFIKRLPRDESIISIMEEGVRKFLAEVEETIEQLSRGDGYLVDQLERSIALVSSGNPSPAV